MPIVAIVCAVLFGVPALAWCLVAINAVRVIRRVPRLARQRVDDPPQWPRLTLIVAARDEAVHLEAAMSSRLADDYPALEVVLVDDRSTDATGAIVDRIAARDARVRAVHITALPDGWLGKLHAMARGVDHATGEWLLFSDADVHWNAGTLRRAVAWCEARKLDHLALVPEFVSTTWMLDVVLAAFVRLVTLGARVWAIEDPKSPVSIGSGLFNLVRRSAFDRTPGFAWLKLDIADDMALAQMLKRAGGRTSVAHAADLVRLEFYRSVREFAQGIEKSAYAVFGRFSFARLCVGTLAYWWLECAPFVAIAVPIAWVRVLGVAASLLAVVSSLAVNRWIRRPWLASIMVPLGATIVAACCIRSGWIGWRRGGIAWRGTFYSSDVLRAGQRFELL